MTFDIQEYKQLYISTSRQLIATLARELHLFYANQSIKDSIIICHRSAHSLKSQSLVMGYTQIGMAARSLELFFKQIVEGALLSAESYELCVGLIGTFTQDIDRIAQGEIELDMSGSIAQIQRYCTSSI